MAKKKVTNRTKVILAAEACGGKATFTYSGRGMFGKRCAGIDCDDKVKAIEAATEQGVKGANYDQMGKGWIVYWPHLALEPTGTIAGVEGGPLTGAPVAFVKRQRSGGALVEMLEKRGAYNVGERVQLGTGDYVSDPVEEVDHG